MLDVLRKLDVSERVSALPFRCRPGDADGQLVSRMAVEPRSVRQSGSEFNSLQVSVSLALAELGDHKVPAPGKLIGRACQRRHPNRPKRASRKGRNLLASSQPPRLSTFEERLDGLGRPIERQLNDVLRVLTKPTPPFGQRWSCQRQRGLSMVDRIPHAASIAPHLQGDPGPQGLRGRGLSAFGSPLLTKVSHSL